MASSAEPSTPPPLPFKPGEMVAGKYRVDDLVGLGGMAAVLSGTHVELDQKIAVKILLPERAKSPDAVRRFLTEARAAAKLKSDHAARISDVGTTSTPSGVIVPYLVMELLEGEDLATFVEHHGRLPARDAVDFVLQACDAVSEAHALGIVHRDIKPANLFVSRKRDGQRAIKLLDFGISKTLQRSPAPTTNNNNNHRAITGDNEAMGSPAYMSPEQIRATKDVDHRTDVWSLGVVLYELLTGRDAFEGTNINDVMGNVVHTEPKRLEELAPDVPADLAKSVHRCLSKDPSKRFQTIAELVAAIAPFATLPTDTAMAMSTTRTAAPGVAGPSSARTAPTVVLRPIKRPPLFLWIGGAVLGMALLLAIAVFAASSKQPATSPASIPPVSSSPPSAPAATAPSDSAAVVEPDFDLPPDPTSSAHPSSGGVKPRAGGGFRKTRPTPPSTSPSSSSHHRTTW